MYIKEWRFCFYLYSIFRIAMCFLINYKLFFKIKGNILKKREIAYIIGIVFLSEVRNGKLK